MQKTEQIALVKRLLGYVEGKTTALADAPFRNDVSVYTAPERLRREQQVLFREAPLLMGFAAQWAKSGDYSTDDLAGVPMLIVRGRDGVLRAFLNVCRHRGAKVVDGCGSAKAFSCPYHAWSYGLDGGLAFVPDERNFPGIEAERRALRRLPLAEKYGLVWVIPTPAAHASAQLEIDDWLGPELAAELAAYDFAPWQHYQTRLIHQAMNWKVGMDTFHEGYHLSTLHRDTIAPLYASNQADFKSYGPHHRMVLPRHSITRLRDRPEQEWDAIRNAVIVYTLLPNAEIVIARDHAELWRIFPVDNRVDRCAFALSFYLPQAPASDDERRHWQVSFDLTVNTVEKEDFPVGEAIQRGFSSGAQSHVIYGRNEPGVINFHRALQRAVGPTAVAAAAE